MQFTETEQSVCLGRISSNISGNLKADHMYWSQSLHCCKKAIRQRIKLSFMHLKSVLHYKIKTKFKTHKTILLFTDTKVLFWNNKI